MADSSDQLLSQARALEAEAIRNGEDGESGRALRTQASALRVRALGERIYPVLVCAGCFRVTGWTDARQRCAACLQREQVRAAFSDPHAGWVSVADARAATPDPVDLPVAARLAALVGLRGGRDRAASRVWLTLVDPDETGPISPEGGYEIEVAKRREAGAPDGSRNLIIRFTPSTYRFLEAHWQQLETTRIGSRDLLAPGEFSAGLPIEQLAEAWADYGASIRAFNCAAWRRQADLREAARQARQAQDDTLRDQQGIAELLPEDG